MAVPGATIGAAETRPRKKNIYHIGLQHFVGLLKKPEGPRLVAAMADADVVIEGVKEKGKNLSLDQVKP